MRLLEHIMEWCLETDVNYELHIGVWDMSESNWYATIERRSSERRSSNDLLLGESTYGSSNVEDALALLWQEIQEYKSK